MARGINNLDNRDNREKYENGKTDYDYALNDFENQDKNSHNPEISDRGRDNTDGKGRGISVDTEDIPDAWKPKRTFWAAFNTVHGAGHNAGSSHVKKGIMANGNDIRDQWINGGAATPFDKENNTGTLE